MPWSVKQLSLDEIRLLDSLCDDYEKKLRAGEKVEIKDFLVKVPDVPSDRLFCELLRMDLEFRIQTDSDSSANSLKQEYHQRYPDCTQEIEWVWGEVQPVLDKMEQDKQLPNRVPDRIGSFELLEKIGQGAMGVVFRARDVKLKRHVALKLMRSSVAANENEQQRFQLEAEAAARLRHPNIVQIFDVGEENDVPYIAMELVNGVNLSQLTNREPQQPQLAAKLCRDLARAIDHAHEYGIIHRDIKPGNILVGQAAASSQESDSTRRPRGSERTMGDQATLDIDSGDSLEFDLGPIPETKVMPCVGDSTAAGSRTDSNPSWGSSRLEQSDDSKYVIKVTDFGLAKLADSAGELTGTGMVLGTPEYMAPEQASGQAHTVDTLADVYAIGGILYYLLTGKPPFSASTPVQTVLQVINHSVVAPSMIVPGIPKDLETICLKCLEKEPARRIASANEVVNELDRFLAGEPIQSRPIGQLERGWRWCVRHKAVSSLLAACVAIFLTGFVLVTWKWQEALAAQTGMQQQQAEFFFSRGLELCEEGDPREGVHWMVAALQTVPKHASHQKWIEAVRRNIQGWREQLNQIEHQLRFDQPMHSLAISPDGSRLITGLIEGAVMQFDLSTGQQIDETYWMDIQKTGWSYVSDIEFHPDGNEFVVSAVEEFKEQQQVHGVIQRFDAATFKPIGDARRFRVGVYDASYFDGGNKLVIAAGDLRQRKGMLRQLDATTLDDLSSDIPAIGDEHHVVFSEDDNLLFCNVIDPRLKKRRTLFVAMDQWKLIERQEVPAYLTESEILIRSTDWFEDDLAGRDLGHPGDMRVLESLEETGLAVQIVKPSGWKDNWQVIRVQSGILLSRKSRSIRLSRKIVERPNVNQKLDRRDIDLSPKGDLVLIGNQSGVVQMRQIDSGIDVFPPIELTQRVMKVEFNQDGSRFAAGSDRVRVWDSYTGEPLSPWIYLDTELNAIAFSPDGKTLATGDFGFLVCLWDIETGKLIGQPMKQRDIVMCLDFSPDSRRIAAGTAIDWNHDPQAQIWDVETCQPVGQPMKHGDYVREVQFTDNGKRLLTVSTDTMARIWNSETGELIGKSLAIAKHRGKAVLDPTETQLLSGGDDGRIQIWDTATQSVIQGKNWVGNQAVTALHWSENKHRFVAGFADGSSRIFDAKLMIPLGPPTGEQLYPVDQVQFLDDGMRWQTAYRDGTVLTWDIDTIAEGSPEQIRLETETMTGFYLDQNQIIVPHNYEQWQATRDQRNLAVDSSSDHSIDSRRDERWYQTKAADAEAEFKFHFVREYLDQLIQLNPESADLWLRRGRSHSNELNFSAAAEDYSQVTTILNVDAEKTLVRWYRQRLYAAMEHEQHEVVLWYFKQLEKLNSVDWRVWGRCAESYWRLGKEKESIEALNNAADQSDDSQFLIQSATKFAEQHSDWERSAQLLEGAAEYEPLSNIDYLHLVVASLKNKDVEAYHRHCNQWISRIQSDGINYQQVRYLVRALIAGPATESQLRKALHWVESLQGTVDQDNLAAHRNLLQGQGALLIRLGDDNAVDVLQQSFRLTKSEAGIKDWILLAQAYEQAADPTNAGIYRKRAEKNLTESPIKNFWERVEIELLSAQFTKQTD